MLIEVSDSGLGAPVLREAGPDAERGRGLQLVAALSGRWGCHHPDGRRKVTWASLPLAADCQPGHEPRASAAEEA